MSQCSERVKHALSPPFVSSGLFSSPRRWQKPAALSAYSPPTPGNRAQQPGGGDSGRKTASRITSASHRLPDPPRPAYGMQAGGENKHYLCGYIDIIYSARRSPHCQIAGPCSKPAIQGFRTLPRPLSGHPSRLRTAEAPEDHQKHTNWSQIMHESPQSASFTGLHCNARIGDILLCLFLF